MGQLLIKEGSLFHSILAQKFHCNQERTEEIKKFAESIILLFGGFSTQITNACRNFFRKLKIDQNEDQTIIFLSKYIIDILNELSKKITIINKKIELDVIDPLIQFSSNQTLNHQQSLLKSEELLYSIQNNNDMLKQLVRNYQANESSLTKSTEEKHQLKDIVQSQIQKCNMKWQQIKDKYQQILTEINSFNSLRCHFTMKTQIQIVKLINRLVNSASVQQSIEEYQDMFNQNQTLALQVKDEMRQKLGKLMIFEQMGEAIDIYNLISSATDEKQKRIIDDFINLFTNRSNLKEQEKNFEQSRALILQDMRWTNYFLTKLKSSLYTEIKLNNVKFRELASIVKYIFAIVVQADDNQGILYSLLYISYRVRCKDQYLIKQLGKHDDFWKNGFLWNNIVQFIKLIKLKGKLNHSDQQPRKRWKQLFLKSAWNRHKIFTHNKLKSQKVIQDAKVYQILCEVNYYMTKLELDQTFVFDFILVESQKFNISKENTKKLLEYHYLNKMITTNKQSSTFLMRKARLQESGKTLRSKNDILVIAIFKSLKYLPIDKNLINILFVCKQWNQQLRHKIFKRFLIEEINFSLVDKYRLNIYKEICHPPFSREVYHRMLQQIPDFTEHSQIIHLDARRSLGWDQKLRVKMIQVLKTFSYYHPDHGYLQGMNYLCENILKITEDTFVCYFIFEHLMNNQYYGMYTSNFDGLKLKIYQFMRMLDRERPQLAQHLRAQKLQGEHFMLSWAITLWGEMSGELCWILWDGFLIQGWIWWFKTTLWLMKVLEPQLIKMNFQEIMKCFSDLHSSLFSYTLEELNEYGIDKLKVKKQIDSIKIQKQVLSQIQKQYRLKSNMINQYLKKSGKRK